MCRRCLCEYRTQERGPVRRMDHECIQMPRKILEVVSRETDIGFEFSAEKQWKSTTWLYFFESGLSKTYTRKIPSVFGCTVDRGGATWRLPIGAVRHVVQQEARRIGPGQRELARAGARAGVRRCAELRGRCHVVSLYLRDVDTWQQMIRWWSGRGPLAGAAGLRKCARQGGAGSAHVGVAGVLTRRSWVRATRQHLRVLRGATWMEGLAVTCSGVTWRNGMDSGAPQVRLRAATVGARIFRAPEKCPRNCCFFFRFQPINRL